MGTRAGANGYGKARLLDPDFAAAHWKTACGWFGNATAFNSTILGEGLSDGELRARFLERLSAAIDTSKDEVIPFARHHRSKAAHSVEIPTGQ